VKSVLRGKKHQAIQNVTNSKNCADLKSEWNMAAVAFLLFLLKHYIYKTDCQNLSIVLKSADIIIETNGNRAGSGCCGGPRSLRGSLGEGIRQPDRMCSKRPGSPHGRALQARPERGISGMWLAGLCRASQEYAF
jgi:hypothetical protein